MLSVMVSNYQWLRPQVVQQLGGVEAFKYASSMSDPGHMSGSASLPFLRGLPYANERNGVPLCCE